MPVEYMRRLSREVGECMSKFLSLHLFFLRILVGVLPASEIKVNSGCLCPTFDLSFSSAGIFVGSFLAHVAAQMAGGFCAHLNVGEVGRCCVASMLPKSVGHIVVGLERVVFRGVAVPANAVAAAFVSFFVSDDLVDGVPVNEG